MEQKKIKKITDITKKEYKEKWILKTVVTILLSLLNIIIIIFLTFYIKADVNIVWKRIIETLKTGPLFITSLSLMSNIIKDKQNIAPENKYYIRVIDIVAIFIGFFAAMFYGASYQSDKDKFELYNYQIYFSVVVYLVTIVLIGCYNFLNRTDDIRNAITDGDEDKIIDFSKANTINKGGLKI
ncbi:hypothetical protein [Fusobacterium polymorphum]|uniref:hypothetical protein n=1 Tax=Fusobacterium nucleatum subsp. polymorphum TaxID=76857 RepID=UPI0030092461